MRLCCRSFYFEYSKKPRATLTKAVTNLGTNDFKLLMVEINYFDFKIHLK